MGRSVSEFIEVEAVDAGVVEELVMAVPGLDADESLVGLMGIPVKLPIDSR